MTERGVVSRVEGETAYVVFKRSSACGKCQACGMLKDMSEITVDVKNTLRAGPGDRVEIEFSSGNSLRSSLIAYGIPLLFLVIGVFLGYYISNTMQISMPGDILAALLGLGLTAAAFGILHILEPRFRRRLKNTFRMVAVEKSGEVMQNGHENTDG